MKRFVEEVVEGEVESDLCVKEVSRVERERVGDYV
jgi:hypothetical protein